MAYEFGWALGLRGPKLASLRLGAFLHDIGKVFVPLKILEKPGPLTAPEQRKVQQHVLYGCLISGVEDERVQEVIAYHHEYWNGQGYPRGLQGPTIPYLARIVAVADAFDAMTNERPYRPCFTHAQALQRIEQCAGTQFDPYLADYFVNVFQARA